jgi:hypothetical protein
MFNRLFKVGRVRKTDIFVILTVNVIVGVYIWMPFIKENQNNKKLAQNSIDLVSSKKSSPNE